MIRLHIGPPKSGSTTIQQILWTHRADLLDRGVLYPDPARPPFHLEEYYDFLRHAQVPLTPLAPAAARYFESNPQRRVGSWKRLLDRVRDHAGPSIISFENLASLTDDLVAEWVAHLPSRHVEAVMVARPASQLIASAYQEMAKRQTLLPFGDFVEQSVLQLLANEPTPVDFINHRHTVRRWQATGVDVRIVGAPNGLSENVLRQTLAVLAPEASDLRIDIPRANPGMSALGVHVYSRHLAAHPAKYTGASLAVMARMWERYPITRDTRRGGRLRLRPEFAHLLDRFCSADVEDVPSAQDVLAAGREGMVEPVQWEPFDIDAALHRMRRWQIAEDVRWLAMSAVSRAIGRGPLQRSVTADADSG
jgi:hypothetical protein